MLKTPEQNSCATRSPRGLAGVLAREEGGFTLVELIVVMVLIGILMTIGFATFQGTQRTARVKAIAAAATTYRNAVTQFQLDHGNRVPCMGGAGHGCMASSTTEWQNDANSKNGPYSTYDATADGSRPYYFRRIPAAAQDGFASIRRYDDASCNRSVDINAACAIPAFSSVSAAAAASVGSIGALLYQATGPTTFRILVYGAPGRQQATAANVEFVCAVGNDPDLEESC